MKKIFIFLLIFISLFLFTELRNFNEFNKAVYNQISNTGINYENVYVADWNTFILNPSEIIYGAAPDKLAFEGINPRHMKAPGYWISKLKNPDKIILSKQEIKNLNEKIRSRSDGITKLEKYPATITKKSLTKIFNDRISWYKNKKYYKESGEFIFPDFFITLYNSIDTGSKNIIKVRYAITTKYNDVRVFPTCEKVLSGISSKDIDRLQEESLDMATPVIVLCQTKDKTWSYVVSQTEEGWIQTKNIAFTNRQVFTRYLNSQNIVVVINPKADVFLDAKKTKFIDYVRMGTKLSFYSDENYKSSFAVKIPARDKNGYLFFKKAFLNKSDVNVGFLTYTQRNILNLAFKHLNEPYGWGGNNGEQDCSGYLSQIFNCFGIILPETSTQKIKCGKIIDFQKGDDTAKKNNVIMKQAAEGISFLFFPGHIMLYIGKENNRPYAIHAIWGLTSYDSRNNKTVNFINKVIVSDLDIGEEVAGNSLIDRVSKFNIIR